TILPCTTPSRSGLAVLFGWSRLAGRRAEILQHEPTHFLSTGDAFALRHLAPGLQRVNEDVRKIVGKAAGAEQSSDSNVAAGREKRPHPRFREAREFDQNRAEEIDLAVRDDPHEETRRQGT